MTRKKLLQANVVGMTAKVALVSTLLLCVFSSPLLAREMTDADITFAVETQLLNDEGVASHLIDVETKKGVVTLSGTTSNLLAKERAERIAETVRGVRAVVNTITVKAPARPDSEILSDVEAALLDDPATESFEVGTSVKDGIVTLRGTVDSWQERELCAEVAKSVKGVRNVKNNIEVVYKEERPDSEIEAGIERALEMDVWVDASLINVSVEDGRVVLSGTARSAAEKSQAYADAWVAGVESVDDRALMVDWTKYTEQRQKYQYTPKTDEEIRKAVKDAFFHDPRVLSFNPEIKVEDGVVTLTGVVNNLKAKKAAEKDAENVAGVWRVKNHLRVRPEEQPRDAEIRAGLESALLRDPFVERFEVTPTVINGKVYLSGTVDNTFEKSRAEEIARGVMGVIEVDNNLELSLPSLTVRTDWEIKEDIEDELWWSPFVDADEVNVSVDEGVATLTGIVDSWHEYESAEDNAEEGGAIVVRNKLKVEYGPPYYLP